MESIKAKIFAGIGVIIVVALCIVGYRALFVDVSHYYTQVDNTNLKQLSPTEFEYNLTAYDTHGKITQLTFKASKQLREDAFLELDVMFVRGVANWREVKYDALPLDVRPRYSAPANTQ